MKEYLRKLGSRKFQAFLTATVLNVVTFILVLTGTVDLDGKVNEWMPAINLGVQTVTTFLYIWVEGSVDKANAGGGLGAGYTNTFESHR